MSFMLVLYLSASKKAVAGVIIYGLQCNSFTKRSNQLQLNQLRFFIFLHTPCWFSGYSILPRQSC